MNADVEVVQSVIWMLRCPRCIPGMDVAYPTEQAALDDIPAHDNFDHP